MRWLDGITNYGHEFEEALGVGDGQESLACYRPWSLKNQTWLSDWTELNWTERKKTQCSGKMKHDLHLNMLRFFSELYAFFLYHFTKAYISQVRKKRHRKFLRCLYPGHWKRKQQHTPGFLFGKSHAQRNLAGYSPWACRESDKTERLSTAQHVISYRYLWNI